MLSLHVLASGSKGNAAIVEDTASPSGLLIDCGICKRDLLAGCAEVGFDPARIADILITHEHTDHTKGLGVCLRALTKLGSGVTIHASNAVRQMSAPIQEALDEEGVAFAAFRSGDALTIGGLHVHVFPTSHDAVESFGFRIESADDALGYLTDTGCVTGETHEALQYIRLLALEANHDAQMLREGPYPYHLKRRIASNMGHLSNDQAAEELERLLDSLGATMLESIMAMHVSQENNLYGLARDTLEQVLKRYDHPATALVARQRTPQTMR